mmetsp:Transcript_37786/g.80476  ORF Transcript_37786/g.80476 Transcript_37786/m.80476 type:complete len:103 (-) Transcript_37786:557-865(-)
MIEVMRSARALRPLAATSLANMMGNSELVEKAISVQLVQMVLALMGEEAGVDDDDDALFKAKGEALLKRMLADGRCGATVRSLLEQAAQAQVDAESSRMEGG